MWRRLLGWGAVCDFCEGACGSHVVTSPFRCLPETSFRASLTRTLSLPMTTALLLPLRTPAFSFSPSIPVLGGGPSVGRPHSDRGVRVWSLRGDASPPLCEDRRLGLPQVLLSDEEVCWGLKRSFLKNPGWVFGVFKRVFTPCWAIT